MFTQALGCSMIVLGLAVGSVDPPEGSDEKRSPLAGPSVTTGVDEHARTLVSLNFDGRVERLELEVEHAAIRLLELSEQQQAHLDRILAERHRIFEKAVRENYDLLIELGSINQQEQPRKFFGALVRLGQAMKEYRSRGTVIEEMAPWLERDQLREAALLVDEYLEARVAEAKAHGEDAAKFGIAITVRFEALGKKVEAIFNSAGALATEMFDDFAQRLKLTVEQQEKIKVIATPIFIQELQGKEVPLMERLRVFNEISKLLDDEQRRLAYEYGREAEQRAKDRRTPNMEDN